PRGVGCAGGGRSWLPPDAVPRAEPRRHQVDEYLTLVERCDLDVVTREPKLTPPLPDTAERLAARRLLEAAGVTLSARGQRVGIHLGAAYGPAKLWPSARVAAFCRLLVERGDTPVLLGAPSDAEVAGTIVAQAPVASLVGRDRPALLPALLSELDVLVSGESGLAHVAAAL